MTKKSGRLHARDVRADPICRTQAGRAAIATRSIRGEKRDARGVLLLLDHYGPFRLAYLEALLRAADSRTSTDVVQ